MTEFNRIGKGKLKAYSLQKRKIFILLILSLCIALIYINRSTLLSYIIPGYEHNPVCGSHKLIASKAIYNIPATAEIRNNMIVKVERWGEFKYRYPMLGFEVQSNRCEASVQVGPRGDGMIISIGTNLNEVYRPVLKINMDLYIFVEPKSDQEYDAEAEIEDFANGFELLKEADGKLILRPGLGSASGLIFQYYNGKPYPSSNSFELVSVDNGETWQFNPVSLNQ